MSPARRITTCHRHHRRVSLRVSTSALLRVKSADAERLWPGDREHHLGLVETLQLHDLARSAFFMDHREAVAVIKSRRLRGNSMMRH